MWTHVLHQVRATNTRVRWEERWTAGQNVETLKFISLKVLSCLEDFLAVFGLHQVSKIAQIGPARPGRDRASQTG